MSDDEVRDDVDFEPEDELGDVGAAHAKLKKVRAELKETQTKRDEYLTGWQRSKADSVNARKETLLNAERAVAREKESFIEDLLPVLDSFDMATASQSWESVDPEWRSGVGHIQSQLLDALDRHGVKRYGKVGDKFDPREHDAAQEVEDGDGESHTILKVLRHGYRSGERILRPAHVIVRK